MTFEKLTSEQQALVLAEMTIFRPTVLTMAQTLNAAKKFLEVFAAGPSDVFALLDTDAVIPDPTGLAGAQPLTQQDVMDMISNTLTPLVNTYAKLSNLAEFVKICGPGNV